MSTVNLTQALRREYEHLFGTCLIRAERMAEVDRTVARIEANQGRYRRVADGLGIPWTFVALTHNMESGLDFTRHLHNGDPLTARTVRVPPGRPISGSPPFTWEESAADALGMKGLSSATDWSLAGLLYQLERYNGWGYRRYHPEVLSPYLWCFSHHYKSGKYVADGTWSDTAVSRQCGAAVLLRRLAERGLASFPDQPPPRASAAPLVPRHARGKSTRPDVVARAEELQRWLNSYPGVFVKVDGIPGDKTSEAYRLVTGHYLPGDPRAV